MFVAYTTVSLLLSAYLGFSSVATFARWKPILVNMARLASRNRGCPCWRLSRVPARLACSWPPWRRCWRVLEDPRSWPRS